MKERFSSASKPPDPRLSAPSTCSGARSGDEVEFITLMWFRLHVRFQKQRSETEGLDFRCPFWLLRDV